MALIELTGLAGREDEWAQQLSYGEQRRLEIARALAAQPKLLLLDEPTAGMSTSEAQSLMALFKELLGKYVKAILLIEHNMRVVMGISDRVHVLDYGEKIAEGCPDEVRQDPRVIEAYLGQDRGSKMLKVSAIHVYYGAIHALKGVSFNVERGELVTFSAPTARAKRPR